MSRPARRATSHLALSLALAMGGLTAIWGVGCGSSSDNGFGDATAGDGGTRLDGPRHDTGPQKLGGNDGATATLAITPKNPQLTVPKPGTTLLFHVAPQGTTSWLSASWSLDAPEIGSFDGAGLFTASGLVGGATTVTARAAAGTATTTLTVKLALTANAGNVSSAVQKQLEAGGAAPPVVPTGPTPDAAAPPNGGEIDAAASDQTLAATGFEWLYPYDGTVFPRGLSEPTLQFSGASPDAVYVHITIPSVEYKGFFGSGSMGQVDIGASVWQAITSSATASDSVLVQITKITSGIVTGPITEHWTIAQGTLKGTVYYNSYDSQLFAGAANGGILKLKPGASAVPLVGGATRSECSVCHAVSSDGSTLIATHPASDDPSSGYTAGTTYDLKNDAAVVWQQPDAELAFGGIYPDGTFLMTNGAVGTAENIPGQSGYGANSRLISTNGGTVIPAAGWDGVITTALSPSFSPDGTMLGFTHYDVDQSNHTIAVMDFSLGTHAFSNLVDIATDPNHFLGWPTFTPDNEWVVFHADTRPDLATWVGDDANLVIAHVASKTTANLDVLNGFTNGHAYVPYGVDDLNHNYEPTMLPVAVGGYYWVVFTSRRNYGNTIDGIDAWDLPSGAPSARKKLWVAALDIDPAGHPSTSAHDISHPAFYLDGQELTSGNSRGFWALDPCAGNGGGCQTGDECCSGFCRAGGVVADAGTSGVDGGMGASDGGSGLTCVPAAKGCSEEYEKCTTSSDCCGAAQGFACINAHCAAPTPK